MSDPTTDPPINEFRPASSRWTPAALRVSDIDATIAWYERFTARELLDKREDDDGYGTWLGHPETGEFPFDQGVYAKVREV